MKPIAFSGKIASGKTSIAKELEKKYGYKIFSIGMNIKAVTAYIIEGKEEELKEIIRFITDNKKEQEELFHYYQDYFKEHYKNLSFQKGDDGLYIKTEPYRVFTQDIARNTRKRFGEDVWIKLVVNQMLDLYKKGTNVVCDDIRVPIEKEIFEKAGFKIIRVDIEKEEQRKRAEKLYGKMEEARFQDETEVSLDYAEFDLRFDNTHITVEEAVKLIEEKILFVEENEK